MGKELCYNTYPLDTMPTNLEKARELFRFAYVDEQDNYQLNREFEIEWSGDGERFYVNRCWYDKDVGYVTDEDIHDGNFDECLNFCKNFYKEG